MSIVRLPIDTKSLYLNIQNDNLRGHTATVATPLKQGGTYNHALGHILEITDREIDLTGKDSLNHELVKNSKSQIVIRKAYAFDKIMVNGEVVETNGKSFCIFIKEEVDPKKEQCGRLKVHYPQNLKYDDVDLSIDNKFILSKISGTIFNYAFIITAFEYDFSSHYLNFDALIVGENQIPYSKVFINEKGVGDKFTKVFNESADDYDFEIIPLRKKYGDIVTPSTYGEFIAQMKETAIKISLKDIHQGVDVVSNKYPYALYDIRYKQSGITKYIILRYSATNQVYFNLSIQQKNFITDFENDIQVYFVTNILTNPVLHKLSYVDLSDMTMLVNSIKYIGGKYNE